MVLQFSLIMFWILKNLGLFQSIFLRHRYDLFIHFYTYICSVKWLIAYLSPSLIQTLKLEWPHLRGLLIAQLWKLGDVIKVRRQRDLDLVMLSFALCFHTHTTSWTQSHKFSIQMSNKHIINKWIQLNCSNRPRLNLINCGLSLNLLILCTAFGVSSVQLKIHRQEKWVSWQ